MSTTSFDQQVSAPAKAWADGLASELQPNANMANTPQSTPGHEFPGAYPPDGYITESHVDMQQIAAQTKEAGLGMLNSARQYIPAQEDVQNALVQAGEAAKQYIPGMAGYMQTAASTEHNDSLPSAEITDTLPDETTGGVSSRPDAIDGTEGAKLPEEQTLEGTVPASDPTPPSTGNTSASLYSTQVEPSGTPHRDSGVSFTSSGGVGDLPGNQSEVGVAVLPDERLGDAGETEILQLPPAAKHAAQPQPLARTHPLGGPDAKWKGVSLAEGHQRALDRQGGGVGLEVDDCGGSSDGVGVGAQADSLSHSQFSSEPEGKTEPQQVGVSSSSPLNTADKPRPPAGGMLKHGEGYHPAADHRMLSDTSTRADAGHEPKAGVQMCDSEKSGANGSGSRFNEGLGSGGLSGHEGGLGGAHDSGSGSNRSSSGIGKPKFMDRVKGEAKVFVGKMGGNEEKVEEGRRMMGKSLGH